MRCFMISGAMFVGALVLSTTLFATDHTSPLLAEVNSGGRTVAPAGFEENKGQVTTTAGEPAPEVRFRYTQGGTSIFLLHTGIAYQFNRLHRPEGMKALEEEAQYHPERREELDAMRARARLETYRMDMLLEGADPHATLTTEGRSTDYTQYYTHDVLDVHSYRRITYHAVYPGIDWVVYTTANGIKYDFVVHPGADPARISLRFLHHEELRVEADGSLTHGNRMGRFTEEAPVSFQDGREVGTRFVLHADAERPGEALLHFDLDPYDRSRTLRIDPARIWSTYYGGIGQDEAYDCTVDGSGNVFMAGYPGSPNNIGSAGHQNIPNQLLPGIGGYLVKFDSAGVRQWGTYYDGSGESCATDGSGNVFLAGTTTRPHTIAFGGHQNVHGGGVDDAYLVKFDAAGVRLWGTYYGGPNRDYGYSCGVDASGNVYLAGQTWSDSAIADGGHQNAISVGNRDAFLVKFDGAGVRQWGTYYGGSGPTWARACPADAAGNVYLAGYTSAPDNIASGGHQDTISDGYDAFLVKFSGAGVRQWGTYYGGEGDSDSAIDCAVDAWGDVYLSGMTNSTLSIASGGHQNMYGGGDSDVFLVKFNASGVRSWSTYYGGADIDNYGRCALDADGNVYIAGSTYSDTAIAAGGYQNTRSGSKDLFLVKFDPAGDRLWGTYYGSVDYENKGSCCVFGNEHVYLCGTTWSLYGIASGGHQNSHGGGVEDAFLVKFDMTSTVDIGPVDRESFLVHPNPANDHLTVRLERSPAQGDRYQVLDAQGRSVLRGRLTQQVSTIDLGPLGTGAYLLQVRTAEGVRTERFIKQ